MLQEQAETPSSLSMLVMVLLAHGLVLWTAMTGQSRPLVATPAVLQVHLIPPVERPRAAQPIDKPLQEPQRPMAHRQKATPPSAKEFPAPRAVEKPTQADVAPQVEAPAAEESKEPASVAAAAAPAIPASEPQPSLSPPRFDAAYLQNPPPPYPPLARRLREQGKVLLRVVVRADGTPEGVELRRTSGYVRLDEAALEVVRRWRFVPARQGDAPVAATVIVPIVFSLDS